MAKIFVKQPHIHLIFSYPAPHVQRHYLRSERPQNKPQIIRINLPITAQNRCPFSRILQHTDIARKHLPLDQLLRLSVIGIWHAIPRIATA